MLDRDPVSVRVGRAGPERVVALTNVLVDLVVLDPVLSRDARSWISEAVIGRVEIADHPMEDDELLTSEDESAVVGGADPSHVELH